jgi:rhodanese-related sulfurtransferase
MHIEMEVWNEGKVDDGYSNVIEYPEGIAGWADAGHPVEQQKP